MEIKKKFTLERTDINFEAHKLNEIYDLTYLKKMEYSNDKNMQILSVVKKMILGTNFSSQWKNRDLQCFLIILHFFMSIIGLAIGSKGLLSESEIAYHVLLYNIILIPMWIYTYYFFFSVSDKMQNVINYIGEYILKQETKTNPNFSFVLKDNLSFQIKEKGNEEEESDTEENIFIYFVTVNIEPDSERILYRQLISKEDMNIACEVLSFVNKELIGHFNKFINKSLIPFLAFLLFFILTGKQYKYYRFTCCCLLCITLLLLLLKERHLANKFKGRFDKVMEDINKENIQKGKFVFRYYTLLIIATLNEKGKQYSSNQVRNALNKIIKNY